MPEAAAGTTTVATASHLPAPRASAPSRMEFGTSRRNCSVVRTVMGISIMASAKPPESAEKRFIGTTTTLQAKMPMTMEGTPFRRSAM